MQTYSCNCNLQQIDRGVNKCPGEACKDNRLLEYISIFEKNRLCKAFLCYWNSHVFIEYLFLLCVCVFWEEWFWIIRDTMEIRPPPGHLLNNSFLLPAVLQLGTEKLFTKESKSVFLIVFPKRGHTEEEKRTINL